MNNRQISDILIYGANGYSAELILERACRDGAHPMLAGRSVDKIRPLAERYGLPMRVFALDNPDAIAHQLQGIRVVLNCAGPFLRTAMPMAAACIKMGVHYLDLNGEIRIFESMAALGKSAESAGVMLMPGVGFDVVPSDCLAAHLKRRLPDATRLTLSIQAIGRPSHGTTLTVFESQVQGAIRDEGKIVPVPPAWKTRVSDCGHGPVKLMSFPWGDVATAFHSTTIPHIEIYVAVPLSLRVLCYLNRYLPGMMRARWLREFLKSTVPAGGPDAAERERGCVYLLGEASNAAGQTVSSRLKTPEGYALTVLTAWDIARRTAGGEAQSGFRTPSMVFGADYILSIAGTSRADC
jgi:short subunit dehydrogenase-like uncharacterized protein